MTVPGSHAAEWERWVREAIVALQVGRFDSVLEAAEEMIALWPKALHGYWYRGLALEVKGNFEKAFGAVKKVLEKYHMTTNKRYQEPPTRSYKKSGIFNPAADRSRY